MSNKKILFMITGGTIVSRFDPEKGYAPAVSDEELLQGAIPDTEQLTVDICHYSDILSFGLTPHMVVELVGNTKERLQTGDYAGVVVVQGTGTIEETVYLADLFWDDARPLVFTGSMLNASEPDWDGKRNILNSLLTAASPESWEKGAMVCLGGEIHAARDVIKSHKTALSPCVSPNSGPLGFVVNKNRAVFHRSPVRRITFDTLTVENRVEIIKIALGSDGTLINAAVAAGAKAIVIESFPGGGGVTPEAFEVIKKHAADGFCFVMCPRSQQGSAKSNAGGGCGPFDLRKIGVITAGDLPAVKARILLMAALPHINSRQELADIFDRVCP